MDRDRFSKSPIGSLVPIHGTDGRTGAEYDHVAFVPDPLADEPVLDNLTWRAVSAANRALGALDQAGRQVPEPALLRRPTLRREAQSTSALEGTFAPLAAVLEADDDDQLTAELTEVLNYVRAAELGFTTLADGQRTSVGMLLELHRRLVRGTAAETRDAGRIRQIQVAIGSPTTQITEARFVPSPPGVQLETATRDLIDWVNDSPRAGRDPVVAAAMAHYQFETLHPFNDGNGRLGRLLIVLGLIQDGAIGEALLSVSPWFEARRTEYQDQLAELSASGDWNRWVRFFALGIRDSAEQTSAIVKDLLDLETTHRERLRAANVRGAAIDIAQALIARPIITVPEAARIVRKGYQTASNAVQKLVDLGILQPYGGDHPRRFVAADVLSAIQGRQT
ncbi:Fic family protein [Jiangella alkaliphila]|uniref:Fic family protein n=1 Tax=Jiangella alkaliphila TaxID=419479 RepID=A0A1H2GT61_9ACTN|nr:Fic/DOC family N-terminal domain-containing protein [Jiangella alkaliphila]SDU22671.1 Fic family protein [Jiangella alkaliphila]